MTPDGVDANSWVLVNSDSDDDNASPPSFGARDGNSWSRASDSPERSSSISSEGNSFERAMKAMERAIRDETSCNLACEEAKAVTEALRPKSNRSSPERKTKALDDYRFYILVRDYAGRLWNYLVKAARAIDTKPPDTVVEASIRLAGEGNYGAGELTEVIRCCLKHLRHEGLDVTLEMARLAIEIYANRNETCHAEIGTLRNSCDERALRSTIKRDIQLLPQVLPDGDVKKRKTLRHIMRFYGESAEWFLSKPADQVEACQRGNSPQLRPAEDDKFNMTTLRDVSPVKPRSVSPCKRTASGSSKPAIPGSSTSPVDSTVEEGLHAGDGILEVIARLRSQGSSEASAAVEEARRMLMATMKSLEKKEEDLPRKRGHY